MQARLSPEGALGLHLTLGIFILTGAAWLFGAILEDVVTGDPLTVLDLRIAVWLHAHATPSLTRIMVFISYLGTSAVTGAIAVVVGFALWRRRYPYRLLALALAVPGGMLLNVLIKYAVHRPRPIFDHPLEALATYSFPSGHALASTVLYGLLAAFAVWTSKDRRWRMLAVVIAAVLIALVCFSRIYLGVHYLSDVLGGIAEGVAWLALCVTAVEMFRRHRASRNFSPE